MAVLERFRNRNRTEAEASDRTEVVRDDADGAVVEGPPRRRFAAAPVVERQHAAYGGINWGAAFFGWLVAVGIGVLLTALLSAAGAAVAISEVTPGEAIADSETISLGAGIALLVIALIAYFAGGYVAGRMSRFDGARQGFGVWAWALVIAVLLAVIGVIAGEEYNVFAGLDLPRIPVDEGDVTTGGIVLLVLVALGTLLAAMAGGKAGEAYHRRVDAAGYDAPADA